MSSQPTIVLITGANQGLGFLSAQILSQQGGYHIFVGSRSPAKGLDAVNSLVFAGCPKDSLSSIQLDVTNDQSVQNAAKEVESRHGHLDVLINNAAVAPLTANVRDQYREAFETNVTGAVAVTDAFLPLLRKSATPRIVYVSSSLGSLTIAADPKSPYYMVDAPAYRATKAALSMIVVQQHKSLEKEGFKVWAVCPGHRATNLSGDKEGAVKAGAEDPLGGAQIIVDTVTGKYNDDVGRLVWEDGVRPW
ncbi:MAG: hypothetical protein Q9219_003257 [cf. Caloplaca sp. 3 TL-2023]